MNGGNENKNDIQDKQIVKKTPKSIISIILIVSLVLNVALVCVNVLKPKHVKFEGNGFNSPEKAISAYAKAFSEGDVTKMLSTFAIETYVENYDLKDKIESTGSYGYYNAEVGLMNDGEYTSDINKYTRANYLVIQFKDAYFFLEGIDNSQTFVVFSPRGGEREEKIEEHIKMLENPDFDKKLSDIKIGEILHVEDLDLDTEALKNVDYDLSYGYLNADELCELAIEMEIDGEEYYLFMLTAKYGNKWYNVSVLPSAGILYGMDTSAGGLCKVK